MVGKTKGKRSSAAGVLCLMLGLIACSSASATAPGSTTVWDTWLSTLQAQGFILSQGAARIHDCTALIEAFDTCNGNNPAGGYIDIAPPIDNEYVDPCYNASHDCSGNTPNVFTETVTLPDSTQTTVNDFYRMDDTQALVLLVTLPPQAAYFGVQSYVWARARSAYAQGCRPGSNYVDPCAFPVRASVGNAINNITIPAQSGYTLGSGQTIAIVTTSNPALYSHLYRALKEAGADPSKVLFLEPLGRKIIAGGDQANVITGLGRGADELNTFVRYTLPQDANAASAWQNDILNNIRVFRVGKSNIAKLHYGRVALARKHYTTNERTYARALDELAADLKRWRNSVTQSHSQIIPMYTSESVSISGELRHGEVGPICLYQETNCLRDTQDTDAYRVWNIGKLQDTAIIAGVESTQTGNATYTSVGVFRQDVFMGISSLSQTNPDAAGFAGGTLAGSASDFIADLVASGVIPPPSPTLAAALPKLFVAIVTRECPTADAAPFCGKGYTVNVGEDQIPLDTAVVLSHRAYIHPGSTNGPNPHFLLSPRIIH
jgi:hypothetical protein